MTLITHNHPLRSSLFLSVLALSCAGGGSPADPTIESDGSFESVTISGRVLIHEAPIPLAEATVRLRPIGSETTTDAYGRFEFRDLQGDGAITYSLVAEKTGYTSAIRTVALDPSAESI